MARPMSSPPRGAPLPPTCLRAAGAGHQAPSPHPRRCVIPCGMQATRALLNAGWVDRLRKAVVRASTTLHDVALHGLDHSASLLYGDAGHATVVDESNFGDVMEHSNANPVVIDCWSPDTAYESMGQTASLILAQRRINSSREVAAHGTLLRYTLDTSQNRALAEHLEVATSPSALFIHTEEVVKCIANMSDDLQADQRILELFQQFSSAFTSTPLAVASGVAEYKVVEAQRHMTAGCYHEAVYNSNAVLGLGLSYQEGADLNGTDGLTVPEILCAKGAVGLLQGLAFADDVAEADHLADRVEHGVPRAVRYLGDVRRALCASDMHRLYSSQGAVNERVRTACLHFLQGEFSKAAAQLLQAAEGDDVDAATHHAQFALLRVLTYATPHSPLGKELLSGHPGVAGFYDLHSSLAAQRLQKGEALRSPAHFNPTALRDMLQG